VISHNVSTPEEVDAVLALAVAAGGTIAVEAETGAFGRIGYFADPDGYLWEVAYTPKWPELSDD
jgi:predicted lactoylglutathione lyase